MSDDQPMIANMRFGWVRMESRVVPDPDRAGWSMFENRSHWHGTDGSHTVTEWEPGVRFGIAPDPVTIEA